MNATGIGGLCYVLFCDRTGDAALAEETQRSLLPHSLPQLQNFRIHAFSQATRFVGGDFYDFLQLPGDEWAGVLADVSGKAMPAALGGNK